ncbi:MAG: hypothetical protein ABIH03_01030, partial [Pseudomonadota bacterium]
GVAGKVKAERQKGVCDMSVYKFADGYPARGMDSQAVGEALDGLNNKHGGLTAEIVLTAARPKASPMHNAFIWNDADAARKYRLRQAGHLIRAVVVHSDDMPTVRRFVNVIIADEDEAAMRYYMTLDAALSDEDCRKYVLSNAKGELANFRDKYANLQEVAAVIEVIDRVVPRKP